MTVPHEFVGRRLGLLKDRRVEIFGASALHARWQITDIVAFALITREAWSRPEMTSRRSSGFILAASSVKPTRPQALLRVCPQLKISLPHQRGD
jgi:hypothetical protein